MFDGPLRECRWPAAALALAAIVATAPIVPTPAYAFSLSGAQFVEGLKKAGDTVKAAEEAQRHEKSRARQVVDYELKKVTDKTADAIERGSIRAGGKAWDSLAKSDSKVGKLAKKAAKRWGPAVRKGLRLVGPVGKVIDTADAGLTVGSAVSKHVVIPLIDGHYDRKSRELEEQILRDAMEIRKRGEFSRTLDEDIAAYEREARAMDEEERRLYAPERGGTAGDGATGAQTAAIGSDPWADDRGSRVADPWAPEGTEEDPWAPDDAGPGPGTAGDDPPDGRVPSEPGDDARDSDASPDGGYAAALAELTNNGAASSGYGSTASAGGYQAALGRLEEEADRRRRRQEAERERQLREANLRRERKEAERASEQAPAWSSRGTRPVPSGSSETDDGGRAPLSSNCEEDKPPACEQAIRTANLQIAQLTAAAQSATSISRGRALVAQAAMIGLTTSRTCHSMEKRPHCKDMYQRAIRELEQTLRSAQ